MASTAIYDLVEVVCSGDCTVATMFVGSLDYLVLFGFVFLCFYDVLVASVI